MRLIGIHIDQNKTHSFVRKSLKDEWYPFYEGFPYPPHKEDIKSWNNKSKMDLYTISSIYSNFAAIKAPQSGQHD